MPRLANVRRRASARLRRNKPFDHGTPLSKIDTRPMVFVVLFLVLVVAISHYSGPTFSPHVDVPHIEAEPINRLDERFVVTVTTTSIQDNSLSVSFARDYGECRVYLPNGEAVDSEELYDRAFLSLDQLVFGPTPKWIERDPSGRFLLPAAYIRADRLTPWQCIAGTIYALEKAGYPEIGLVATSVPYPQSGAIY